MSSLSKFIFLCSFIFLINPTFSQQDYDKSNCYSSQSQLQGYICSSNDSNCNTYVIYRAQHNFSSIASIASLFSLSQLDLLIANNLSQENSTNLPVRQEVIIPIECQCRGGFFHAPFAYNMSSRDSISAVACEVFEGLAKPQSLVHENQDLWDYNQITVPIRCACPNSIQRSNGVRVLVTYPIFEGDNPHLIAYKFNLTPKSVTEANNLNLRDAIFPKTTLLIPTNDLSNVNWDIRSVPGISPAPKPLYKVISNTESTKWVNSHVILGAGVCFAVITMAISCGIFRKIRRMNHPGRFLPLTARNSVSLDFLDGVSKLKNSIISYSLEEIRLATEDFGENSIIGKNMYKGRIGSSCLAFELINTEEIARDVIPLLTKINHVNIVKLVGVCGETNSPYLVLEYAENGSLRKCMANSELNRQLTWARRLQIAFDIAAALHYLHNSTTPPFVHSNISSSNVVLTIDWRAKLCGFGSAKAGIVDTEGKADDVYAFGIVLLELVSGKVIVRDDHGIVMDSISCLIDKKVGDSWNLMESLREFIDSEMEGNYGVGEALCLVVLAKTCIEEDPHNRPTMNDILIALSRIII